MSKKWTVLYVFFLVAALATTAWAQIAPARYLEIVEINVKSGSQGQFETFVKKIREATDKVGAPQAWTFAQPVLAATLRRIMSSSNTRSGATRLLGPDLGDADQGLRRGRSAEDLEGRG